MRLRHLYLGLCLAGVVLPYWQLVPWVRAHGLDPQLLLAELFSTRIGAFFGMDVFVSALVLFVFMAMEGWRLGMRNLWLPAVCTLAFGVSLGFPLFLYMRQHALDAH